jgi:hypothetical protein
LAAVEKNSCAMFVVISHIQCREGYLYSSIAAFRRVASKLDLNFVLFIESQSIAK